MMKRSIIVFLLSILGLTLLGVTYEVERKQPESFERLWEEVNRAIDKDRPRTAYALTEKLVRRATDKKKWEEGVKAYIYRYKVSQQLSVDSMKSVLGHFEAWQAGLQDKVAHSVAAAALAEIYARGAYGEGMNYDSARVYAGRYVEEALADMKVLAKADARKWKGVLEVKTADKAFKNDLLHLYVVQFLRRPSRVGLDSQRALQLLESVKACYEERGRESAVLLTQLWIDKLAYEKGDITATEYAQRLTALKRTHREVEENAETIIDFCQLVQSGVDSSLTPQMEYAWLQEGMKWYKKSARAKVLKEMCGVLTKQSVSVEVNKNNLYPGEELKVRVSVRNRAKVKMELLRFDGDAVAWAKLEDKGRMRRLVGGAVKEQELAFSTDRPYAFVKKNVAWRVEDVGIYALVENGKRSEPVWLFVSKCLPLVVNDGMGQQLVRVVDRRTGALLENTEVMQLAKRNRAVYVKQYYKANEKGIYVLKKGYRYGESYVMKAGADGYASPFTTGYVPKLQQAQGKVLLAKVYSDRKVYRPGQKMEVGAVVYEQGENERKVWTKGQVVMSLYGANGKMIEKKEVKVSDMGVVVEEFALPKEGLTGVYKVKVNVKGQPMEMVHRVRVEAYKRPTFELTLDAPKERASMGQEVVLRGVARSLSGQAMANVAVKYVLTELEGWYGGKSQVRGEGKVKTNERGEYEVKVKLGEAPKNVFQPLFGCFRVVTKVVAGDGETHEASRLLMVGKAKAELLVDFPEVVCKEQLPEDVVVRVNTLLKNDVRMKGEALFYRHNVLVDAVDVMSGEAMDLRCMKNWESGDYEVKVLVNGESKTMPFYLLGQGDERIEGNRGAVNYAWENKEEGALYAAIGAKEKGTMVYYHLFAESGVREVKTLVMNDSLAHFVLPYDEKYGDGASVVIVLVKQGKPYVTQGRVVRPQPVTKLKTEWMSIRRFTTPGAKEVWRLKVCDEQGKAVAASVMATMYDAGLNAFGAYDWKGLGAYGRRVPRSGAYVGRSYEGVYGQVYWGRSYNVKELQWGDWAKGLYGYGDYAVRKSVGRPLMVGALSYNGRAHKQAEVVAEAQTVMDGAEKKKEEEIEMGNLRTDFSETAYFVGDLRTNVDGEAVMEFALPESNTTWCVKGFVHDRGMRYALLNDEVVARKEVMVQVAVPRFVRKGDQWELPVTVRMEKDTLALGTLRFVLVDAQTNRVLRDERRMLKLTGQGEQVVRFDVDTKDLPEVVGVKVYAETSVGNDGEEHLLAVLNDEELVVKSVPFAWTKAGNYQVDLSGVMGETGSKKAQLTVEASSNPIWYVVGSLPMMTEGKCWGAVDWAERLYALELAEYLAAKYPEIGRAAAKSDEGADWSNVLARHPELKQMVMAQTPFALQADEEAQVAQRLQVLFDRQTMAQRKQGAWDKLARFVQADGGVAWFEGMGSNLFVTLEVATLMERQRRITGKNWATEQWARMDDYIDRTMHAVIEAQRTEERRSNSVLALTNTQAAYLYLKMLQKAEVNRDMKYLLGKVEESRFAQTMLGKARALRIAQRYLPKLVPDLLASLLEYTVSAPQMGVYFDSPRAVSGRYYRLPTQCAAIEALKSIGGHEAMVDSMRLWLLQSKRTQLWQGGSVTADAVYALLDSDDSGGLVSPLATDAPLEMRLMKGKETLKRIDTQGNMAGYVCATFEGDALEAETLEVEKKTEGLSWGAVFAHYYVEANERKPYGEGLSIERRWEVWRNGKWTAATEAEKNGNKISVEVGEKVREVYRIVAQRDYDFVAVDAERSAALEPCASLSGYRGRGGDCYYEAIGDERTQCFFEKLRKGEHWLTLESYVVRAGDYEGGSAQIKCLYAPEFNGATGSGRLKVGE